MKKILLSILFLVFSFLILSLVIPGSFGNPNISNINEDVWRNGPFEYAQRARYGLIYSFVEDGRLDLPVEVAKFSMPDIGYDNGKYSVLFAPGTSFALIPGYVAGKMYNYAQLGVFYEILLFSIINAYLISLISRKLGANFYFSIFASFIFLFATPVFFYSVNLYQHQVTLFLFLMALYFATFYKSFISTSLVFLIYGFAFLVDYPNALILLPVALYSIFQNVKYRLLDSNIVININWRKILAVFSVIPGIMLLLWFNKTLFSNPFQLTGTTQDVIGIQESGQPVLDEQNIDENHDQKDVEFTKNKSAFGFFDTRNLIQGLSVHLLSPDRGIIYYAPVLLFAFFGLQRIRSINRVRFALLISLIGVNIILYSMWGDPWGGWSFGSRYLIPTYAVACIILAFSFEKIFSKSVTLIIFFAVLVYSILVNSMGIFSGTVTPPKIEAEFLEKKYGVEQDYTFRKGLKELQNGKTKSFIYKRYFNEAISTADYYDYIAATLVLTASLSIYILKILMYKEKLE